MHKSQASPQPNPLRTKKYWLKISLAVAAAVMITTVLTAQLTITQVTQATSGNNLSSYAAGTYNLDVLCGSIVLNPNGMYLTGFNVPDETKNATLQGKYSVADNTTNNSCTMVIWSQQEFLKYFDCKSAVPVYNRDFIPKESDDFNITLSSGNYFITIGAGSIDTEVLEAQFCLNFTV